MAPLTYTAQIQVHVRIVDSNGNDSIRPIIVDENWPVEMKQDRDVRVKERNGAALVDLSAPIATGSISDGITTPSLVVALSRDNVVHFDPNNLYGAPAGVITGQLRGHLFLLAAFDGSDTQCDSIDLVNGAADSGTDANDANVVVASAGDNT